MQRRRIVSTVVVFLIAGVLVTTPLLPDSTADASIATDQMADTPDLVFAQPSGDGNVVCYGVGSGFSCWDLSADSFANPLDVVVDDIDSDGDFDLVFAAGGDPNAACLRNDTGTAYTCTDFGSSANHTGIALGDVDRDGDLDAVVSLGTSTENEVCDNDGSGGFTCTTVSADTDDSLGVALGDLDGDGWLDAVFANDSTEDQICLNDGDGTFTCADASGATDDSSAVALGDLDGDGDLDAYFTVTGATDQMCTGSGTGTFSGCANADSSGGDATAVELADFDWDGDLDSVISVFGGNSRKCANDGSGSFTCADLTGGGTNSTDLAIDDLNRDGNPDVVIANAGAANRMCAGDGSGGFTCANVSSATDSTGAVAIIPAQPNLDVVFGIADATADNVQCRGGGDGTSWQCGVEGMDGDDQGDRAVLIADFDRDGRNDVVVSRNSSVFHNQICLNDGDGTFTCSDMGDPPDQSNGAVFGDFDADGDLDVVFANAINRENQICFNDGAGGFATCSDISVDIDTALDVAAGDLDADGDLDLLFANSGHPLTYCENDGSASFTCADRDASASYFGVALADFDGDGDLDSVSAVLLGEDRFCENDGAAAFTCSDIEALSQNNQGVVAADFDNDGDIDALFAHSNGSSNRFCENDGSASFTCSGMSLGAEEPWAMAAGDLDRDGFLDVIVSDDDVDGANQVCLNDGDNTFTCSDVVGGGADSRGVAIGDLGHGFCDGQYATLEGTAGDDEIDGTTGADVIQAWAGDDTVDGDEGDDLICLGEGNDSGVGGEGEDTIYGEGGDDDLDGADAGIGFDDDYLDGGDGTDRVLFTGSAENLIINLRNGVAIGHGTDTLVSIEGGVGFLGDDTIVGTSGDNELNGGVGGDDTIYPVGGTDVVDGGGAVIDHDYIISDWEGDGATVADPVEVTIAALSAGAIWYEFGASGPDPGGYELFDTKVTITAPAESATDPLILTFLLDSTETGGVAAADVAVLKDGTVVPDCDGVAGDADPDPCVDDRTTSGDDVQLTILTSSGSDWAFGERIATQSTVGLVDPAQGYWRLRAENGAITEFYFGNSGDYPFMGDWDCDGIDTPGLYRQSDGFVYLRNTNDMGIADWEFFFGNPGDVPIAGDFDNDGCDTVSIYRPGEQRFYIINELGENGGGLGAADYYTDFGNSGDTPFAGDFDGDGLDEVGLHRASTGLVYYEDELTVDGGGGQADHQFYFGNGGDRFVAGDWTADGTDTVGVFRPSSGTFFFRYTNTQGNADEEIVWGSPSWLPVAGSFGLDP